LLVLLACCEHKQVESGDLLTNQVLDGRCLHTARQQPQNNKVESDEKS
jgi:hypothetical protein